jgi:hypothetical protein
MSAPEHWDDGPIHAYVDGELDAFTAARLEAACRQDAALNSRVERQRQLRSQLGTIFNPVLDEPLSARLLEAASTAPTATVTPIGNARPRAVVRPLWIGALAASLVIGLSIGWIAPRDSGLPFATTGTGLVATGYLDAALSQALSSEQRPGSAVQLVLSFQASDGTYCRSFSLASGSDGMACRAGEQWRIEILAPAPSRSDQDYRQAGSALSAAVLAAIGQRQSGDVLDAEEEQQARGGGWQASGKAPQ